MVGPRGASGASPGARPGSARGVPLGVRPSTSGAIPGRSRGVPGHACRGPLRARVPAASRTTRGTRRRTTARGPGHVRPCEAGPRTTGWVRPVHDPDGPRPEPTAPGSDHARPAPDSDRTGPTRAGQGGTGRGRTGRAASRTTESPPRRAPRVRPRGPAPMHDLRGLGPRTTAGVRPRARPCGVRAAYDREGRPRWATCSGRPACDPRGARAVHDRAGFELRTTARGSDCARPCGARTVHHRPGFGACASRAAFARMRPHRVLDPVRPRRSAPCGIARVRPRADRAEPGRVRPCEAPAAYGPGGFRLCSTVWGLPRVRPRAGLRPRTT